MHGSVCCAEAHHGAPVAVRVELRRKGRTVQSARTDDLGGYLFRNVDAGSGYTVVVRGKSRRESRPVRVLSADAVPYRVTISLSPPLLNMFADPLLQARYERFNRLREWARLHAEPAGDPD